MHNYNDNNSSSMITWMMVLCCALPIIFLTLFSSKAIGAPTWLTFGVMVVFLIIHFWLMKKSHNHQVNSENDNTKTDSHSNHDCH